MDATSLCSAKGSLMSAKLGAEINALRIFPLSQEIKNSAKSGSAKESKWKSNKPTAQSGQ